MRLNQIIFWLLLACALPGFSQTKTADQNLLHPTSDKQLSLSVDSLHSTVHMSKDLTDYIAVMDSIDRKNEIINGYRIQIYSVSGPGAKEKVYEEQTEFLNVYRRYPSYPLWNSPNWVLRVGNFRTRLEAEGFHEEIKANFPASFVISDEIESPYKE